MDISVDEALARAGQRGDIKGSTLENIRRWLQPSFAGARVGGVVVGESIARLVRDGRWAELDDGFFQVNAFGTAGVRGRLAIGSAHFNEIVLGLGVEAHARYIQEALAQGQGEDREKAVVLAYDSRVGSWDPATGGAGALVREAACIYAAHGIAVYVFDSVAPTPELSFAICELQDIRPVAGGVFTASHNPATDNGFKPYDFYGGQIVHAGVQRIADSIDDYAQVRRMPWDEACDRGLIREIGPAVDAAYIAKENQTAIWVDAHGHFRPDMISPDLTVVYSALNGTSQRLVPRVLERRGFDVAGHLVCVPGQCEPDGAFPTCPRPNPEEKQALNEALRTARQHDADLVIATDPDGDRIGVGVRLSADELQRHGSDEAVRDGYFLLTGNQQLVLLTDYILSQLTARDGSLPAGSLISKTIVSTDLALEIARGYDVMTIEPHVGFKFLGEKLYLYARAAMERGCAAEPERYAGRSYASLSRAERTELLGRYGLCCLFGGEESYGSLVGDYVKDKDAVTVAAMFVEMAGFCKLRGTTLIGRLEDIWQRSGYCREETISLEFQGAAGNDVIRAIMARFREDPPADIAGRAVVACVDYRRREDGAPRRATNPAGEVLFEDVPPDKPDVHTGYVQVAGIAVPAYWHADVRLIGERARMGEADVIMFVLAGGSKIVVRPSGTEPKIKFYVLARGSDTGGRGSQADVRAVHEFFERARAEMQSLADDIARPILRG